jgi:hypothetical protein
MKPNIIATIITVFIVLILLKTGEFNLLSYISGVVVGCAGVLMNEFFKEEK